MNKQVLVTGGFGFLGSYVVKELFNTGNEVTIMTSSKKNRINLPSFIADVRDIKTLEEKVKRFDMVYHIAGNIRTKQTDIPELHYSVNAQGTLNLLKACELNNIPRFILISTAEVYGAKEKENITEDEEKNPETDYGKSKLTAEQYCREFSNKMKITILRPSYIYGYGMNLERLFPRLIERALKQKFIDLSPENSGNDFIYVKDAAAGIILLGERHQQNDLEYFNLSSGGFSTINEIFEIISKITGTPYKNHDIKLPIKRFSFSIEKARKIGYNPRYDLKKGLEDFILDYKKTYGK